MSPRNAWALVHLFEGAELEHLAASERWRLREMRTALTRHSNPQHLLEAWLRIRAQRVLRAAPDVAQLRSDRRVVASGVSDVRSQIAAPQVFEGYILSADLDELELDHLLAPANVADANVILHAVVDPGHMPSGPVPRLALAADLAEWGSWRESNRAREIIAEATSEAPLSWQAS